LSLLFRSVYVINFVLGFAVQIASISTTFSSAASVGNWFHQKTAISYMPFFTFSSPTWLLWTSLVRLGFAEQLQAGTAKRKTPHSQNAIYFDRHFSASTAPWVLTRGEAPSAYWFNSTHNSAALRLVPSIPHPGGK
jgi:hypothetical protein